MELRQLKQFVAVADLLSFRRAAERLHMAQPPLSVAIRKLEDELGAELFERRGRTIRLTPAGHRGTTHLAPLLGRRRRSAHRDPQCRQGRQRARAGGFRRISHVFRCCRG
jgi:DNA-binding transcriptional LysR family regulator